MTEKRLRHILLTDQPDTSSYTGSGKPIKKKIPTRNRQTHGEFLHRRLQQAWTEAENEQAVFHTNREGIYLEFKSDPGAELVIKSLESMRSNQKSKHIRLLNVREDKQEILNSETGRLENRTTTYATVYVPNAQKKFFFDKLEKFLTKETDKGNPVNAPLINSIADIRKALLVDSFWIDPKSLIPEDDPEWCEVWLRGDTDDMIQRFLQLLEQPKIISRPGVIRFPERSVIVIYANKNQLERLSLFSDDIAEYRRAKETADFWIAMDNKDQAEWVEDLLGRIQVAREEAVSVCILDHGVNNGHPLLKPIMADIDCQSVDPGWGTHDHHKYGHGALMAGVAAYGNLAQVLSDTKIVELDHRLESVKIMPPPPEQNEPQLYGYVTAQGISRAEIEAPERKRIICLAVTAEDTRDQGRPTSWSGELDQLAAGAKDNVQRLLIISAGNISDPNTANNYSEIQTLESIHDPAQSWNALTVGACTGLDQITDSTYAGYTPIAPKDGLSPFSTTSCLWENDKWPIKPDIVMEGGNMAVDDKGFVTDCEDLSVLSTSYKPQESHFSSFNATSAATAKAAWLAARIQASYPKFWPETVRALMVHSAEWPETLKKQFVGKESKTEFKRLLSICGYGLPSLERALYSAGNSLTLISQATLQPYDKKTKGGGFKTKDMHLYELPWPKEVLLGLPDNIQVKMRITLSYFIEPGPGEVGWQDRYRYASHGLRFDLNSPGESKEEFTKRINNAARDKDNDEDLPGTKSPSSHWMIGSKARDKGSVHSDIWQGTASELADSNLIAISPIIGWWRERSHLDKWNRQTRYALIVSIFTPDKTVDVYTPVAIQLGITIPVEINV
ncbi:S8 family peptidase [Desulfobacterales bacterium HSG16]|nr:S8 family peptidase [Desulfobacterales bacterium HSG16]